MNKPIFTTFLCLFLYSSLIAQDFKDLDYAQIDSFALSIKKKYRDLDKLAWVLTHQYKEDHEKVRAIFRWITNNISYDKKLCDEIRHYGRLNKKQKEKYWKRYSDEAMLHYTIQKRKTVCKGYALLFSALCRKAGLATEYISGYDREEINKTNGMKHAWNAVKINKKWYLLDATWASGYLKEKEEKKKKETDETKKKPKKKKRKKKKKKKPEIIFERKFDENYYLTPSYLMIYDHFPDSSHWQLLDTKIDKTMFKKFPIVGRAFFHHNTIIRSSNTYTITAGIDELVNFRFQLKGEVTNITLNINRSKYAQHVDFQRENDEYIFTNSFAKKGSYLLDFYINRKYFITQKVVVR